MAITDKDTVKSGARDGETFNLRTGKDLRDLQTAEKHEELEQSCTRMQNTVVGMFGLRAASQHFSRCFVKR